MIGKTNLFARRAMGNILKYHSHGGVPGENLPFSIENRYRLSVLFVLFFGSGFSAPFLILRHQMLKA